MWANSHMCKTSKTPDVHIPNIITPKEIFQKFITVCFNDKMRQLYFETTKLFKNSQPIPCRKKEITNIPFQILFPKETGKGQKSLYKSENRKRERVFNSRIQTESHQ